RAGRARSGGSAAAVQDARSGAARNRSRSARLFAWRVNTALRESKMRKFLLALGSILLQACVSVLPEAAPPSARYEVTDVSFANFDHAPVAWTLGIDEPGATLA